MTTILIRPAEKHDSQALWQLNRHEMGYQYSLDKSQNRLAELLEDAKHHLILVAIDPKTQQLLGYIHAEYYATLYAELKFNLLGLAVDQNYQRQGIGTALINDLIKIGKTQGIDAIRLNSGSERTSAHQFYQALGFRLVKTQKSFLKKI
ncbi:GNAT family N-acetyltransferase [Convivina intestini]|uniref:N-acetyltransferase domain-containing protein n=1 Tax=Convivina intestini TaxID=1505726 RepID=A0A2U1DC56_9LACO|nr:GNAT family N-acetyltransferase [Convivina intestini]PVY85236.1 hypothetical protein C7384_10254 [Convivina intestini]CAH1850003.1 hypothetical protein R078131_00002 [Convivina intestini]CAH1852542.1 hypothetical protein R077811_00454 [Convivina intestini]SDB87377.1 hypothetical protein SAMN05216341_102205 [Leuconostocaceae bacterium R-53105]